MDSINFDKYGITFEVGKEYENGLGTYKVNKIEDNKLFVKYFTIKNAAVNLYTEYRYDAEGQAQSIYKMNREAMRPSFKKIYNKVKNVPKISNKDAFTLGYLAKHAYIMIEVGPNSIDTFPGDFKIVTKLDVKDFEGKGYYQNPGLNKYTYGMSITFPVPDESVLKLLDLPKGYIVRETKVEINNTEYVWHLLNMGFLPGRNDDNPRMTVRLPNEYLKDYYLGFDL